MGEEQRPLPGRFPESRPLSDCEEHLIEWLLAHGTNEAAAYRDQLPQVQVVSRCSCGCPTIDLTVNGRQPVPGTPSVVLSDCVGRSPEGVRCEIILHARVGLSELEVYSLEGKSPFSLPDIESIAASADPRANDLDE